MSMTVVPPVVRSIVVEAPPERAFRVFTEEIGRWWPVRTYSIGEAKAERAGLEPRLGGRLYERWTDGTECLWGEITIWEPPTRLAYWWKPNQERPHQPTEVEVTFDAVEGGTRVVVEHRGWEALGELAERARSSYDKGWAVVLEPFRSAAERRSE
jgi:uncharacterized protein YndB with AHSA1/START domain